MIVIPAIDIKNGKVVRLRQGMAEHETIYSELPAEVAETWAAQGAELIHIVDLDGAIKGEFGNLDIIKEIADNVDADIEVGGGIRDEETISKILGLGVKKVVIGTKALEEKFLLPMVKRFGDSIVVGIDARDGFVYTRGWLFNTKITAVELTKRIADAGVRTINFTDIARDGTLIGPNIESLKQILKSANIDVIASGGVSNIEDVKRLKLLEKDGLKGMIIGKALYEKTVDLKEAIKICSQKE